MLFPSLCTWPHVLNWLFVGFLRSLSSSFLSKEPRNNGICTDYRGKFPSGLLTAYKTTICATINLTFQNCTFNWGKEGHKLGAREGTTVFISDFFHLKNICRVASIMACAKCEGNEEMSLWKQRSSPNHNPPWRAGQALAEPALLFSVLCSICFVITPSPYGCWSLKNILE